MSGDARWHSIDLRFVCGRTAAKPQCLYALRPPAKYRYWKSSVSVDAAHLLNLPQWPATLLIALSHLFLMQDGFRELLHLWKFNNRPNLSRFLASLFKEAMIDVRAVPIASGTRPLLIPIPTQWHRQFWRGFDHTWLLAQALGHAINPDAEIRPWLRNNQKRQSHHQLSRALRWANSEGRFVGDPRIQGREVVLIDDVMTTGATVSSAALACHLKGARSVRVWCLARTPAPSKPR